MNADMDQLRENYEEEQEGRADAARQLAKANAELQDWRSKVCAHNSQYSTKVTFSLLLESGLMLIFSLQHASGQLGGVSSEEMDELKRKFNAKLQEAQDQLDTANSKCSSLEKAKSRLSGELEDLMIEVERVRN